VLLWSAEPVSHSADRLQHVSRAAELGSQPCDVHIHSPGLYLGFRVPCGLQKLPPRLYLAAPLQEDLQQPVLERREVHILAVGAGAMETPVEPHAPDDQNAFFCQLLSPRAGP
jgi:hypothetical protein